MSTGLSFPLNPHPLTVVHAGWYFQFKDSFLLYPTLAATFLAGGANNSASALTMPASATNTEESLLIPNLTMTRASGTSSWRSSGAGPSAATRLTSFHTRDFDLGLCSEGC